MTIQQYTKNAAFYAWYDLTRIAELEKALNRTQHDTLDDYETLGLRLILSHNPNSSLYSKRLQALTEMMQYNYSSNYALLFSSKNLVEADQKWWQKSMDELTNDLRSQYWIEHFDHDLWTTSDCPKMNPNNPLLWNHFLHWIQQSYPIKIKLRQLSLSAFITQHTNLEMFQQNINLRIQKFWYSIKADVLSVNDPQIQLGDTARILATLYSEEYLHPTIQDVEDWYLTRRTYLTNDELQISDTIYRFYTKKTSNTYTNNPPYPELCPITLFIVEQLTLNTHDALIQHIETMFSSTQTFSTNLDLHGIIDA